MLPGCGDVACQIDLLEGMYRCARARALRDAHRSLFKADFLAALDALAARPTKGGALDLGSELRRLLVAYNRQLAPQQATCARPARPPCPPCPPCFPACLPACLPPCLR